MLLLELNDVALTLRDADRILYQEPAHALADNNEIVFGSAALAASRLHPLESSNSYLDKLSTEPLPRPLGSARTYADLVYQHLQQLVPATDGQEVCIGVGANVSNEQLAILLGIAKEAGLKIGCFVDNAVLATSATGAQGAVTYIDVTTHHLLLTRLTSTDDAIVRDSQQILIGCGAQGMTDGWTALIADQFVQASRFDPLHSAASEQQLVNQLTTWRQNDALQAAELSIDIQLGTDARRTIVAHDALEAKTASRLQPLREALSGADHVVLSSTAAGFPGLATLLETRVASVTTLSDAHVPHAMRAQPSLFEASTSVRLFTELPVHALAVADQGELTVSVGPVPAGPPPTHVLNDGDARPIDTCLLEMQLPLARSGDHFCVMPSEHPLCDSSGNALTVGSVLAAGVPLRWNGGHYQLITVSGS